MKKTKPTSSHLRYRLFNPGSVDVPKKIEVPVFLIIHELKLHMIYRTLQPVATFDAYMEVGLHKLILKHLKMLDGKDQTYEVYFALIDKWATDFSSDPDVIVRRALKVYNTLLKARNSRKYRGS